jgi:hypothetical protein
MQYFYGEIMKNKVILGGIAAAILLFLGLRKDKEAAIMEEKLHELQEKFKSLDAA